MHHGGCAERGSVGLDGPGGVDGGDDQRGEPQKGEDAEEGGGIGRKDPRKVHVDGNVGDKVVGGVQRNEVPLALDKGKEGPGRCR